jgi:hypothetical protein
MQQMTLRFCAALGVLLAISSFVETQEVVFISDDDINPVEAVSLTTAFAQTLIQPHEIRGVGGVSVPDSHYSMLLT